MFSPTRKRSESTSGVVDLDMSTDAPSGPAASLDELLSPTTKEGDDDKRESVVDSGIDVDVDDERFSNIPLSGASTLNGTHESRGSLASVMLDRRSTISLGRPGSKATGPKISRHKKSASSYAAGSALRGSVGNLPFLLQRLDLQKSQDKANHRDSSDGQQRLQEEFNKLQNGHQTTSEEDEADDDIDWGAGSGVYF